MTQPQDLAAAFARQKEFFRAGHTRPLAFREQMLRLLKTVIEKEEEAITRALAEDFGKPAFETYATEIAILLSEIKFILKYLRQWVAPKKVKSSFLNFPSTDAIYAEPYGVALVIGAWNYPFQLTLSPVIGAIAAGCCAILKPSEMTPATSQLIARMVQEHFPPEYLTVAQGGPEVSQALLDLPFDKMFFTGSTAVGKIVAQAAAKHLTPVTLELGGKSPCLVDATADLAITAKRIVWGKFINAGQTCVAPDYILVQENVAPQLLEQLAQAITQFYGPTPAQSPDFARIINQRHFQRLKGLLTGTQIYAGGETDESTFYIAPTLLQNVSWQDPIMQEEIFGPLLPVLTYSSLAQAIEMVNAQPKPLALYFFSKDRDAQEQVLTQTSSGGACINDTVSHLANPHLPFGGVGPSGNGNYHGKASFDAFSHQKSVLKKPSNPDIPLRYPPYAQKLTWMKRAFKWL
ncbi:aldehyde dehydrogenase [Rufibacter radiotolerans]|uniref:Aldehyde dehydrogenase n=1 Tax=Rufibacter radiotolerans TaxID=1379910 RepID=A0A0H4VFQ7_9BACT|nr:aldehyde dehydrogenase [Rufibacter radiotolerans]AKQ44455.1 aldehyde dehydrogenase [Rufibacter radiotolerans]